MRDYQPTDASPRFVWAAAGADRSTAQLLCDARAIEAGRRAAVRFRRHASDCLGTQCTLGDEAGNADPHLYAEQTENGPLLIGYWNGLAGDADRARLEAWRTSLSCDEVVHF